MTDAAPPFSGDARARVVGGLVCGVLALACLTYALAAWSWDGGVAALLLLIALLVGVRSRSMQLEFEVGQQERHRVVFSFNKFWGNLAVTVDGHSVVRDLRTLSVSLTKTYHLTVGDREIHQVRIEKDRARLLAGARRQPVRAYVDDVLTAEGVA
ncbi:hypothetical protein SAMN04488544_2013 [Microlunatus sagamiharensis]|uniref:Uncharacterized protein n=1 Tax=Microlunatus sagamiharensis TaxID=546874 RepID=A0A1H2MGW5_9ACTN|nr:hypothetical protein [Microlunatus sagamiharensis]SDU92208.1 hypothetical protein SAMN04488544_2013 [Microlunatus sagamiharensis]